MSLVLGILARDKAGNQEVVFASDGRAVAHDTKEIRNESFEKIKKLTPKICMGYAGSSGELYEDVYKELDIRIKGMKVKDLPSITSKLKSIILEQKNTKVHKEMEKSYGPLIHKFIIGGVFKRKLRINTLNSKTNFQIKKHKFPPRSNIFCQIFASNNDIQAKVEVLVNDKLGHEQTFDEIVENTRDIISKASELCNTINNHIFIRRLSRDFEQEKYIGFEKE